MCNPYPIIKTFYVVSSPKCDFYLSIAFFVRDLPYDIIDGIANLLNPKGRNNWTRLAGRLGYTQVDVGLFGVDPCESTQLLLRDWATRESSTVENLHKHLREIKRHDAARLLEAH